MRLAEPLPMPAEPIQQFADILVCQARRAATGEDETPRGPRKRITAFLVDVGMKGFTINEGTKCVSYRGYKTFELHFDDVRLGPSQVLGKEGKGLELAGNGSAWAVYGLEPPAAEKPND